MPFNLSEGQLLEMIVKGTYGGQAVVNVFHYEVQSSGTSAFPIIDGSSDLLDAFQVNWRAEYLPLLSTGYTVESYRLQSINLAPTPPITKWEYLNFEEIYGVPPNDDGSGGAASLASALTVNYRLKSGIPGRSRRGRKAIGPVPETATEAGAGSGNLITAVAETAHFAAGITTRLITVGAGATGFQAQQMIASLKNYIAGAALVAVEVTSVQISPNVGTQNSRKPKSAA